MKVETNAVTKLMLTDLDRLDPVTVIAEDIEPGKGKIIIECYGKAWSSYWGGMGDNSIADFFISCDENYIANKLSDIESNIYDIEGIRNQADLKNIDCFRDDPWNDYEFMRKMYGDDMSEWYDSMPKQINPHYRYLCRIIKAVQEGLKDHMEAK